MTIRSAWWAVVAMIGVLSGAGVCRGADVWRMAGGFNNWNANDESWTLRASKDRAGVFELERPIGPGSYEFKFVRNGDWGQGHLGLRAEGGLEQPGLNIPLRIGAMAMYRVTLDTGARTWSVKAARVEQPVPIAHVMGTPVAGRPFAIDFSESLFSEGEAPTLTLELDESAARWNLASDNPLRAFVQATKPGPLTVRATLTSGGRSSSLDRVIEVGRRYELHLKAEGLAQVTFPGSEQQPEGGLKEGFLIMLPQGPGVFRALIGVNEKSVFRSIAVLNDARELVLASQNVTVEPGLYAVEVRDGEVVTQPDPSKPFMLIPGHWRMFEFAPVARAGSPLVWSAWLLGDFNAWAAPGSPGAIALEAKPDGTFAGSVNLPPGVYRYQVALNGEQRVAPATTKNAVTAPDGTRASLLTIGKTAADIGPVRQGFVDVEHIRHDPSLPMDFLSIEPDLGLADIAVSTAPGDVTAVMLRLKRKEGDRWVTTHTVPMHRATDPAGFDRWSARVMAGSPELTYCFAMKDGNTEHLTRDYRATVAVGPKLDLPAWAMGATWYQIFPERFRNANPLNDQHGPGVFGMKWTADWYKPAPGEAESWAKQWLKPGQTMPERTGGEIYNYIWDRRYGGDLQGIVEKLGELKALGVTAIYLNPVFEAQSMHKYDATDFRHIDDNFALPKSEGRVAPDPFVFVEGETEDPATWTWTPADRYFIDEFLPACRQAGIRVVIDGVFNHTGRPFWAFADIEKHGINSAYKDWFFCEFDEQGRLESWQSWFNTGSLPKFRQESNGDLVAPVKKHIFDITRRWMDPDGDGDPSDGVDGWRLDVALDVGLPFWKDWRELVKSINPEAIIIAEIWDDAAPYLTGDAFDTQMNYPFAMPVIDWLAVQPGMTSEDLGRRLSAAFNESAQTLLIHQNLFGSHDTDRYVSMLWNPNRGYDQRNREQESDGREYKAGRPPREVYELSLVGVAIQATYIGAPMIYYGDEYGMWGSDDPTNRKPLPWPDTGRNDNRDDEPAAWVRKQYAEWFNLRNDAVVGPILRYGSVRHLATGNAGVFAFERELNGKRVVVVANREKTAFEAGPLLPKSAKKTKVPGVSARWWLVDGD